jgi:integrase
VFESHFAVRRQHLKNAKHVQQWESSMRDYVFPKIGDIPVSEISADDVLDILKPIWFTKPETAGRVLQRMNAIFDSAILRGLRERANPCVGVRAELGTKHRVVKHHPALPWRDVPDFVVGLRSMSALNVTRLALEFLILTACRSGEVRNAPWSEFDIPARLWTIPAERMKGNVEHVVPLSGRALEILAAARELHDGSLVFPAKNGSALSDNTLSKLMRDGGIIGCPHGFRSSFKDWAASSGVRDEVSEAALAHADPNKVRGAYRRTKFLEERVEVMARWAAHVLNGSMPQGAN